MKSIWTDDIKIGDLIVLAQDSYLYIGIFCGRGPSGTIQYFSLWGLENWLKEERTKPWKSYINNYYETRVGKYSPEGLSEKWRDVYEQAKEKLKI